MQEDEIACFKDEATHGMTSDLRAVIFFRSAVLNLQGHRLRRIGGCGAAAICAPNGHCRLGESLIYDLASHPDVHNSVPFSSYMKSHWHCFATCVGHLHTLCVRDFKDKGHLDVVKYLADDARNTRFAHGGRHFNPCTTSIRWLLSSMSMPTIFG